MKHELGPNTSWMIVYVADSQPEAHIVVGRLEASGIPAWLQQEPVGEIYGFLLGRLSQVKVVVRPVDYDDAMALLEDDPDDESDYPELDEGDDD